MISSNTSKALVTVFSSSNHMEAGVVRGYLESHGISVSVRDEHTGALRNYLGEIVGGIKIQVPSDQVQDALALLHSQEADEIREASRPKKVARLMIWTFFALIALAFLLVLLKATTVLLD